MPTRKTATPKTNSPAQSRTPKSSSTDESDYLGKLHETAARIQQDYAIAMKESQVQVGQQWTGAANKLNDELRTTQEDIYQQLVEAYRTFTEGINNAFDKNDRLEAAIEAFQEYNTALTEWYSQRQLTERIEKGYLKLLSDVRDAQSKPDSQALSESAYKEYAKSLNESWGQEELAKQLTEAQDKYAALLTEADDLCKQRANDAYKNYASQVEEILSRSDYAKHYEKSVKEFSSTYGNATNDLYKSYTQSCIAALQACQEFQDEAHT